MSDPYHDIAMAAADLAVNQPEQYVKLLDAFRNLDQRTLQDMRVAPPDQLLPSQGKAWLTDKLKTTLEGAVAAKQKAMRK